MAEQADTRSLDTVAAWCARHRARLCVLFGSRARDAGRDDSDYDLALWATEPEATDLLEWRASSRKRSGRRCNSFW